MSESVKHPPMFSIKEFLNNAVKYKNEVIFMDENKMFDILEKIYAEIQEIKKEVKSHTYKFNNVDNRLDGFEDDIKKLIYAKLVSNKEARIRRSVRQY